MHSKEQVTIGGLDLLAAGRGYAVVPQASGCWLVNRRTRLPETNEPQGSLVFTFDEAWDLLESLSRSNGR